MLKKMITFILLLLPMVYCEHCMKTLSTFIQMKDYESFARQMNMNLQKKVKKYKGARDNLENAEVGGLNIPRSAQTNY